MEAIWNRIHVERPPNSTWRVEAQKFDVSGLRVTLERIIKDLESQDIIHLEATILSRLIYRMKCKFRNDKGFKNMEKVNRALLNYLALALEKEYKNFQSYVELDNMFVSLPSKQMLEYVLVRTQGFAKLLARVEEVAKCAGTFLRTRIILGHAWTVTLLAYAVISRIWILSRHMVRRSCVWYNGLYRFLNTFKAIGLPWLSANNALPPDLKSWLDLPWLDEEESSVPDEIILKDKMFKLLKVEDDDLNEDSVWDSKNESNELEITDIVSNMPEKINSKESTSNKSNKLSVHVDNDLGEVVNRSNYSLNIGKRKKLEEDQKQEDSVSLSECKRNKKRKKKELVKSCDTTSSMTISDLVVLLHKDSYPGMDKLQWNIIKNKCNKFLSQSDKCSDKKKKLLIKKAINLMQESSSI